jgi:Clp amino terminal domain, pathogenicity island component
MTMLGKDLETTIRRALAYANARQHEYSTIEHLLLGLLDDPDARDALMACGADVEDLRTQLTSFLDHELCSLVSEGHADAPPTAGFQRIVQRAAIHVQASGRSTVNGANVLVALFSERESHAAHFLAEQNVTRLDIVNYVIHGKTKPRGRAALHYPIETIADCVVSTVKERITFVTQADGEKITLQETQEILDVLRIDVNWVWRVSETIARYVKGDSAPYWVGQTLEELRALAGPGGTPERVGTRLNTIEFDPLDETLLERPLITFIEAKQINPLEVTIAITARSLTILLVSCIWSLRTWKRAKSEEEFMKAKISLMKRMAQQIKCERPSQLQEIETLVLGLFNAPNGLHER